MSILLATLVDQALIHDVTSQVLHVSWPPVEEGKRLVTC